MPSPTPDAPVPRPGSSLQFALQGAGRRHRPGLLAWMRWWHAVSEVPYTVSDPAVADRKLAWWAQAVGEAFRSPAQHPLLQSLFGPGTDAAHAPPPLPLWLSQIQGLQVLTGQTRWMDQASLRRHMNDTTGAACEGAAWMMGARTPEALEAARLLGVGLRRAHILARLGQDARQGWLHIPIDVLQAHGVRAHALLNPAPQDRAAPGPDICGLLEAWANQAREDLTRAWAQGRALPSAERDALRPLAILARLYLALLDDLQAAGYPVLGQRLILGPRRKLWVAWTARWQWCR